MRLDGTHTPSNLTPPFPHRPPCRPLGGGALLAARVLAVLRTRRAIEPGLRKRALRTWARAAAVCALAAALFAASLQWDMRFDWTFEGNFRLSSASVQLLRSEEHTSELQSQ